MNDEINSAIKNLGENKFKKREAFWLPFLN